MNAIISEFTVCKIIYAIILILEYHSPSWWELKVLVRKNNVLFLQNFSDNVLFLFFSSSEMNNVIGWNEIPFNVELFYLYIFLLLDYRLSIDFEYGRGRRIWSFRVKLCWIFIVEKFVVFFFIQILCTYIWLLNI